MNYQQALHYLYNKLPLFSRTGAKAYKADLRNTLDICRSLDNPQNKCRTIHVAGTNGKGSVSHMLAAIFQQNGYKTGLYTSPHLKDFRERIKINGAMIPKSFVTRFVEKTKPVTEEIKPSFFELTFVMALDYFVQEKVDIAIIETGLGGRLDSTNVITPLISIITNIGFDHMDILGDTLPKIAFEKAGIIKQGIPVVVGQYNSETKKVFQSKAKETGSEIYFSDENFKIISQHDTPNSLEIELQIVSTNQKEKYQLDLQGSYQKHNLVTALTAVQYLKKQFSLEEKNIKKGLENTSALTGLKGRWQILHTNPLVVLDVAHNVDGIKQLVQQVSTISFTHLHIILGMVKDKDAKSVLINLPAKATYYFTKAQIPRALDEKLLKEKANHFHLKGESYPMVAMAMKAALNKVKATEMLLVCGSVFVVAEVDESKVATHFLQKKPSGFV